jgi:DNA-binding response OmpR family regulator
MNRGCTEQAWGSRILLVEDSEELRDLMQLILESEGYAVSTATTAEEGLDLLEHEEYDLVVSDYALPAHTGIWLLREAVARHLMPEMQGIIVTAHPEVRDAGAFPVLYKPLDFDRFLDEVRIHIACDDDSGASGEK